MSRRSVVIGLVLMIGISAAAGWRARHVLCIDGIYPPWIDDTVYAPGYSHRAFCELRPDASTESVQEQLGRPLGISWSHGTNLTSPWIDFTVRNGEWRVRTARGTAADLQDRSMADVRKAMGPPSVELWGYSDRGQLDGHYRVRVLHIKEDRVVKKIGEYYVD